MNGKLNIGPMRIAILLLPIVAIASLYMLYHGWQEERNAGNPGTAMQAETWGANRHVLFISSYHDTFDTVVPQRQGLQEVFSKNHVSMDTAYMDVKNYDTEENERLFCETLRYKLSHHEPYDAILLGDDAALSFGEKYQQELFPETPMVFFAINDREHGEEAAQNPWMTGSIEKYYTEDTLATALQMRPGTKKVIAIYDETQTGMGDYAECQKLILEYPDLSFSFLDASVMTREQLAEELRQAPRDSIVLYLVASEDRDGRRYTIPETASLIAGSAPVPVFRQSEGGIRQGLLGGKITDYQAIGRQAAQTVVDILNGRDVSTIPLEREGAGHFVFNYQTIKRFGIPESLIPEGAILLNPDPSFWKEHRAVLLPMLGIVAVLLCLLAMVYRNYRRVIQISSDLQRTVDLLAYQSSHDVMTKLPNRQSARNEIERRILRHVEFTAMIADLDNFKRLNDFYNHAIANEILVILAGRIRERFLKKHENSYAARIGGDEFMLLLPGTLAESDTEPVEEVMEIFHEPVECEGATIPLTASLGIVHSTEEQENSADLMFGNADIALVEAKRSGKSRYAFYRSDSKKAQKRTNEVEDVLRDAIEREAFTVLYQPQVKAATKELHGFESLARLSDAQVYPGEFIPVAESTGMIVPLGRIITKKVLQQMHQWKLEGRKLHRVAINYSFGQLADTDYPSYLADLMKHYDIPASLIEIEVTESLFIGTDQQAHDLFLSLASKGIRMALDDFGTGYSSLNYLTYLPVSVVKIDKSLVDAYLQEEAGNFMETLIQLIHSLNKTIVVEGVEHREQFEKLRKYKADIIQGYYFSRPIPADQAIRFDPSSIAP